MKLSVNSRSNKASLSKLLKKFAQYRKELLRSPFAQLPWNDTAVLEHFSQNPFEKVVVVGIGGSSLGAKALLHENDRVLFLDNIDPDFVASSLRKLDAKQTLFVLISKSGETIEIISLAKILLARVPSPKNFLVITDNPASSLGKLAKKHGLQILGSEENVPGRFSVLSIIGLLPATLAGVNVNKIISGAQKASWRDAYKLACHQYLQAKSGKNIAVVFPYLEGLSIFADWYIQLLSESIGKSKKIGITPIKAVGVKDQHSQLQLFLDGPDDKFYMFIKSEKSAADVKIPGDSFSLGRLFDAEYRGVKGAFVKKSKPFAEISFEKMSPEILGQLFFFFELEVAFLGMLFDVDFCNQPAVEFSKKITKSILEKS